MRNFNVSFKYKPSPSLLKGLSAPDIVQDKSKQQYTYHETPKDAPYYPGTLNKDSQNKTIISDPPEKGQVLASMRKTAADHGGVIASDYSPKFTKSDSGFTKELFAGSADSNKLPKINYDLMKKMEPYLDQEENGIELSDILDINIPPAKSQLPDLGPMAMMGEPRWSTGSAIQSAFQQFMPIIDAHREVTMAGGTTVQNNYICDPDGNPIVEASPLAAANFDKTLPTYPDLKDFVIQSRQKALKKHADAFLDFLRTYYLTPVFNETIGQNESWEVKVYALKPAHTLVIKLTFLKKAVAWMWDSFGDFSDAEMQIIKVTETGPHIPDVLLTKKKSSGKDVPRDLPKGHFDTYNLPIGRDTQGYKITENEDPLKINIGEENPVEVGYKYYFDQMDYISAELGVTPIIYDNISDVIGLNCKGIGQAGVIYTAEMYRTPIPDYPGYMDKIR